MVCPLNQSGICPNVSRSHVFGVHTARDARIFGALDNRARVGKNRYIKIVERKLDEIFVLHNASERSEARGELRQIESVFARGANLNRVASAEKRGVVARVVQIIELMFYTAGAVGAAFDGGDVERVLPQVYVDEPAIARARTDDEFHRFGGHERTDHIHNRRDDARRVACGQGAGGGSVAKDTAKTRG